jgi:hypothetical protein
VNGIILTLLFIFSINACATPTPAQPPVADIDDPNAASRLSNYENKDLQERIAKMLSANDPEKLKRVQECYDAKSWTEPQPSCAAFRRYMKVLTDTAVGDGTHPITDEVVKRARENFPKSKCDAHLIATGILADQESKITFAQTKLDFEAIMTGLTGKKPTAKELDAACAHFENTVLTGKGLIHQVLVALKTPPITNVTKK